MKKQILTLLATVSFLTTTPVLAMEESDLPVTYAVRPYITNTTTADTISDEVLLDLLKSKSFLYQDPLNNRLDVYEYDSTNLIAFDTLAEQIIQSYETTDVVNMTTTPNSVNFSLTLNDQDPNAPLHSVNFLKGGFVPNLLENWVKQGLIKTDPIPVTPGQTLTVKCTFSEVTEKTAIDFLNTAQNAYYPGGLVVDLGDTQATFSSIVPPNETQTWLIFRNPAFNGLRDLSLGLKLDTLSIDIK
ncbi:MAG: hypothetical protein HYX35_04640 [Proteobacteria bacterium]|nr:hypothetical protein [Pseudomonadota bacterium]